MRYIALCFTLLLSLVLIYSCGTESTPVYTLTTSVVGEGTISPSGGEYKEGETVTLTATPSDHWLFSNWSGDGSGSSSTVTITMDRDKNVVGNFERRDYPLTITIEGEGTVSERIVSTPKTTDYPFETVIELTPNPSEGWRFVEWSGDLSGNEEPIQITISDEKNVTVKFEPIVYLDDNGITIMCPYGEVGDKGIVDGVEYEVVDKELLEQRRDEGEDLTKVCVSLVTDMSWMFTSTSFNQPIGNWDVSNVTDMTRMFHQSLFNQPIGNWDVSSVISMSWMFFLTPFNQPIGNWDVSNVTDMSLMFSESRFNQPISNWDVISVKNMDRMFAGFPFPKIITPFNQSIEEWDVSNVTDMSGMFLLSNFNQPIGNWDVSNVTDMSQMFWESQFNKSIGNWDVSSVTRLDGMFFSSQFNRPIGNWDVSSVMDMSNMFRFSQFNQHIDNWDVSNVTDMWGMFSGSLFDQNISNWCVWRIGTEPKDFSTNSPLTSQNKPRWGTCPD